MVEKLILGLSLMGIGMVTVFAILWLVVMGGSLLIKITNRFYPGTVTSPSSTQNQVSEEKNKIAAISAVVETITQGRGNVISIVKR